MQKQLHRIGVVKSTTSTIADKKMPRYSEISDVAGRKG